MKPNLFLPSLDEYRSLTHEERKEVFIVCVRAQIQQECHERKLMYKKYLRTLRTVAGYTKRDVKKLRKIAECQEG